MAENMGESWCRIELYQEYLKKIGALLTQIHTVEKMACKAEMELRMLEDRPANDSRRMYRDRLLSTVDRSRERLRDLTEELRLVQAMKEDLEDRVPLLGSGRRRK